MVSLSFSTNKYAKTQFFSWRRPFQTKFLFFQTIESARRAFAAMAGSGKPAFLHALFHEDEKQNSRKILHGNVFPLNPRSHAKFSSCRGKKNQPKKLVVQAPLQLDQ